MKQSEDPQKFFVKFGFTRSCSMPHPVFKDEEMHFEGLEADYVNRLEMMQEAYEKQIRAMHERIDWLMNKDFYLMKERMAGDKK